MKITLNPLLMLRTPSSLSLNALLIINGLLFEREKKNQPTLYSSGLIPPWLFIVDTAAAGTRKRKPPACPLMLTSPSELQSGWDGEGK